ncbi:MAG: ATP-binding protein [Hydrogenophaga sp.]|uniref:sensor histidine kinase n=2 Tax=Hydrogenophaga sp. TaxID=1904254 RepID=UPI001D4A060F|nr:sensor histidine kinase [Hydrogenophaga sp.]MBW0168645.1 response regulator [Hydrogenophaga sp.]MBW0182792.1 response regulator [Hydrogenophaga sp.]
MNAQNSPLTFRPATPWLLALALWLIVATVTSMALWQLRRNALEGQKREMELLSLALTDELDRGLRGAEEGLQALGLELGQRRFPTADNDTLQALRTRVALMPLVTELWLLGKDLELMASSDATPMPDTHTFLPALQGLEPGATALSRPFVPRGGSQTHVALAFRVGAELDRPGGWIIASIPADMLLGAFGVALPAADSRMTIFRSDGVRLAGANVERPRTIEGVRPRDEAAGTSPGVERVSDHNDLLIGLHRVPRYGLDVVVSRELHAALSGWRGSLELSLGALGVLLIVMAAAVHIVTRSEQRRIAAQSALQAQRARASRLEALGALAGGVSHDFNNVLAGIVGYGEMAQDAAVPGSDQARHLAKVLQAADRGRSLIERILSFSKGGARASTVFELEPVVEEVLSLLTASLRPGVVLERVLEAPGARLRGDATQAFEAVMNLCTNAIQAMPDGGMLSVQLTRRRVSAPKVLSHTPLPRGDYLALSVIDEGQGITAEAMEHLFEPFFTSRDGGSGTGLGLAVVFGVVAEFGGGVDVESHAGEGARFTLFLPECTDAPSAPATALAAVPEGGGQQLLVVDDEANLLAMADLMLQGLGYRPVCFDNAGAALLAIREAPNQFSAVITDEVMPGMSGTQLTRALREWAPHLPVLLVSGYGGAHLAHHASNAGVDRVLMKPIQRGELARALAEVLR